MITTFKVTLIVIMLISFIGAIGDDHKERVLSMASICIASMLAFVATMVWVA